VRGHWQRAPLTDRGVWEPKCLNKNNSLPAKLAPENDRMIDRFLTALAGATARVPKHYFQLPVAGQREPLYRERVYSYELYHQLRVRLDDEGLVEHYALSGEIDKGGHPIIRHRCAPDLVFHIPGAARNLVVVEVKPINASRSSSR